TSWLSAGVGGDIPLSPLTDEKMLFAGEISARAAKNLSFNASFAPNAEANFGMIYTGPSRLSFTGRYRKFFENKLRNRRLQKDRISFGVSAPFSLGGKTFGVRLNGNINRFPNYTSTSYNYGASAPFRPVHLNFLGRYTINKVGDISNSVITTQLIATINALRWFRPQIRLEYDHTNTQLVKYGIFIGKRVFRTGQLALNYERNNFTESNQITLTFNLFTNYAHIQSRSIAVRDQIVVNQVYRGSIQYDQSTKSVRFDKDNAVGLGAVVVRPFLDVNYNGARDAGEESVSGLWAKVRGSSGQRRKSDNLYFYERLQPYDNLLVEIDAQSLDDPILRPTNENYHVKVTPNMITTIDIPVVTTSDISGKVTRMTEHGEVGAGGVRIFILNISSDIVTEVTTFNDGEFFYLGLLPGKYRVYLDSKQLAESGYRADRDGRNFEILPKRGGESIRGVNFNIIPVE
ncbi:MAG: hypothetical protein IIB00_10440, partial [candidate division Zixibacteria bacterium]|nr:hypothetical protein [candidate division Zixibacteria bacterium]